jgi:hypothetical protein
MAIRDGETAMSLGPIIWNIVRGLGTVVDEVSRPLNLGLAFFLSVLPRRYWRGIAGPGILLSGLAQAGFCLAGLLHVYAAYAQGVAEQLATATLTVAGESGSTRVSAAPAMAFGALTPFGFFAVSAPAWVLAYGLLSGLIRALGYAADHPCGDPILTFLDDVLWDVARGIRSRALGVFARARAFWNH